MSEYGKASYAYKRKLRVCVRCGEQDELTKSGRAYCAACLRVLKDRQNAVLARRRAAGLCVQCGKKVPDGKHSYCADCLAKRAAARRRKREEAEAL